MAAETAVPPPPWSGGESRSPLLQCALHLRPRHGSRARRRERTVAVGVCSVRVSPAVSPVGVSTTVPGKLSSERKRERKTHLLSLRSSHVRAHGRAYAQHTHTPSGPLSLFLSSSTPYALKPVPVGLVRCSRALLLRARPPRPGGGFAVPRENARGSRERSSPAAAARVNVREGASVLRADRSALKNAVGCGSRKDASCWWRDSASS